MTPGWLLSFDFHHALSAGNNIYDIRIIPHILEDGYRGFMTKMFSTRGATSRIILGSNVFCNTHIYTPMTRYLIIVSGPHGCCLFGSCMRTFTTARSSIENASSAKSDNQACTGHAIRITSSVNSENSTSNNYSTYLT